MESMLGQTLGQYQLVEQIGKGGMATVYKAYQPSLSRYVAIKVLPAYYAHEPGFAERFTREAKAIAQLDHPHILPVYDFGKQGDISYIVMKYVPAGTLHDKLGVAMSPAQAADTIEQIAGALDHAHEKGILHRDIKPSNILLDERGWIYLSDFGLAKMVEGSVQLTGSGVGVGTPSYMSPEQGQGLPVDARTDVYALGVILFEMLTGHVPYEAETPMAVVIKHITDPIPLPRQMNPNIPASVEQVLLKAMAKDRDHRFASAGEMAATLRQAVQTLDPGIATMPIPSAPEPVFAPPPRPAYASPPPPARPQMQAPTTPPPVYAPPAPPRRGAPWLPIVAGVGLVLIVGLCAVGGAWFWLSQQNSSPPAAPQAISAGSTLTPLPPPTLSPTFTPPPPTSTPAGDTIALPTDTPAVQPTDTPISSGDTLPASTDTPTLPPPPTPTFTPSPAPPRWADTGVRPTGRFADVWNALNAANGDLGYPLTNPVGDRLCARQYFERGYMIWFDSPQDPDPVWAAVMPNPALNNDQKSYKFTDTWPGNPEYWCSEAQAHAPLGPKRGFGMLWCTYTNLRADIGNARDEEKGGPDNPRCAVQPFQGGAIVHNPLDAKYWVFIDNGGWYRFDQ